MKLRIRSKARTTRSVLSTTLPAAGLSLLTFAGGGVGAQESDRVLSASGTTEQNAPWKDLIALMSVPQEAAVQEANPNQQKGLVIGEIIITGNKTLSSAAIIALSGHKVGDPCNDQTLLEMRQNLARSGNFGMHHVGQPEKWVEIIENIEDPSGSGKCKLTFHVDENDKVEHPQITGSGPIKPEEVAKKIKLSAVYREEDIIRDTQDIQELYNKQGYSISFGPDLGMDPDHPGVLLVPIIVTRVEDIRLVKNKKTKPYVIFREMKTKKGDYFNRITFDKDRARLYNLDLFEEVIPGEEIVGDGKIRLTLNVPEKRTGQISVGVGYSNRQQLIGRAEVSETNFGGRGEAVNLLWETGGAANRNSIELGYTRPWLDNKQTALQVSLYDKIVYRFSNSLQNGSFASGTIGNDNRYNEQRTGGTITLSRPIRDTVRLAFTLRGENVRTDPLALSGVNTEIIQNGPIYSGALSLLRDTRDLVLDPVSGSYQTASIQVGHANLKALSGPNGLPIIQAVTGPVNFGKGSLEWRQYFSLQGKRKKLDQEKSAIAMRVQLGAATGTLPFFEQFFVGGAETLRGYREDRFWGKYNLLGSIELRQPLARRLKGVLFLDAGDAWGGSYSNVNITGFKQSGFKPHFGVGLGIRVGTPLGPIRLDYGFGDEGGRTHFSIGNVF
jgi:outer membrane protein insertion porin family